jgi:serine/threonine protein kinase
VIGQTISHYRIVSQLGSGGMGVVYAAEDDRLGRAVALKFVPEDLAKDSQAIERLVSEARTASALNHANICTIHDIGDYDGRPFIVMELLQGQTLRDRLATGLPKIHEVISMGIQVADALDAAHRRHIIHRDIKPANLFLLDRGQVKILDFGLAKLVSGGPALATKAATTDLTAEGMTLGTVSYMSPEQVAGEQLDGRTDLFSFGVVLYECVTGRQPFPGKTSAVVFSTILNQAPIAPIVFNPEMPVRLQEVINNCLEKDRELRYQDAAGLRADLLRLKRDLESGHSGVVRLTGAIKPGLATGRSTKRSSAHAATSAAVDLAESYAHTAAEGAKSKSSSPFAAVAITLLVVALSAGLSYVVSRRAKPAETAARGPAQALSPSPLDLAEASLKAKNYRAALALSEQVLQTAPKQPDALRIRDEARDMIARFDEAVARARNLLASGDTDGVSSALDAARAIDPTAPAIGELSARLVNEFRNQAEAARKERQARAASPAPPPPQRRPPSEPPAAIERQRITEPAAQTPPAPAPTAPPPAQTAPAPPPPAAPVPVPTSPESPAPTPAATPEPAQRASQPTPPPTTTNGSAARDSAPAPASPVEDDDAAIRRIVATYARAIETKDIALFRSVKPNLSSEEQRRVEDGFRAVTSQRVAVSIVSIDRRGQEASVRLRRRDTIQAGGREQTSESQQTMTLIKTAAGWTIREIGR